VKSLDDTEEVPEPILLALHPELLDLVAQYREAKEHELAVYRSPAVSQSISRGEAWVATSPALPRAPQWPGFDASQEEWDANFQAMEQVNEQREKIMDEQHETFGLVLDALKALQNARLEVLNIASEIAEMLADALAPE
jgi:hypothetical protein